MATSAAAPPVATADVLGLGAAAPSSPTTYGTDADVSASAMTSPPAPAATESTAGGDGGHVGGHTGIASSNGDDTCAKTSPAAFAPSRDKLGAFGGANAAENGDDHDSAYEDATDDDAEVDAEAESEETEASEIALDEMSLFELISDRHFAAAIGRCQARPAEARRWDSVHVGGDRSDAATWSQCLPLHRACSVDPSPNLIAALLSAYPDAIAERESYWGRLPLHVACLSGASYDAVQPLLQRYPQGGSVVAIHDRLPLHYACGGNAPRRIVLALLKIYPRGARCLDAHGELACICVRDACVQAYLVPSFLTMLEYNVSCLSSM